MKAIKHIPGIVLSALIALLAIWLEGLLPVHIIGSAVIAMFIGMISAFVGFVFCDFSGVFEGKTAGLIPVFVMLVSAVTMLLCGALMKITKARWISDYALPASLIIGMASAIPITSWLA